MVPTKNDFIKKRDEAGLRMKDTFEFDYTSFTLGWEACYNYLRANMTDKELLLSLIEEWIDAYIKKHNYSPTYVDVAKKFKMSTQSAYVKLKHYRHKMRKRSSK